MLPLTGVGGGRSDVLLARQHAGLHGEQQCSLTWENLSVKYYFFASFSPPADVWTSSAGPTLQDTPLTRTQEAAAAAAIHDHHNPHNHIAHTHTHAHTHRTIEIRHKGRSLFGKQTIPDNRNQARREYESRRHLLRAGDHRLAEK